MAQQKTNNRTILKNPELVNKGVRNTIPEIVAKGNQWDRGNQSFAAKIRQQEAEKKSNRPVIESKIAERKIEQVKQQEVKVSQSKQNDKKIDHGKDK